MKILITGATSFIGKSLLPLIEEGNEIYYLVRAPRGFSREILWDFRSPLPEEIPVCDVVIHLAACVHFGEAFLADVYEVNTLATLHLTNYAKKHNAYFIF